MTALVPAYADSTVTLHHGDCLAVLRELSDASVDSVVTDPPYGLEFMGKAWDKFGGDGRQPFRGEIQTPDNPYGRSTVRFAGSSSYGARTEGMRAFQTWCEEWAAECLRVLRPGGHLLAFGGTRTYHRLACAVEDAGFEIRDSLAWLYGSGFPKSLNLIDDDGERTGWGTALKPAFEPIVMGRRPLAGTVAANVLKYGTGALNVDACRKALDGEDASRQQRQSADTAGMSGLGQSGYAADHQQAMYNPSGRWPANVVLDESQAAVLDEQSGATQSRVGKPRGAESGDGWGMTATGSEYDDQGGASRFFYVAKADRSERVRVNGVAHPTVKPLSIMRWLVRLVTPEGGTVLEPFAGSGTTVEACLLEGFQCVAIEEEADYLPLIKQRIHRRRDPVEAVRGTGEDGGLFDLL